MAVAEPPAPSGPAALTARVTARLRASAWRLVVDSLLPLPLVSPRLRSRVLRLAGVRIEGPTEIRQGLELMTGDLRVGPGVFVNRGVTIHNTARVTLEADVALGPGVLVTTTHHRFDDPASRAGTPDPRPVLVGRGTWVGARAVVLPGVTIGEGCVVAAGAVVTRDCAPHGLYAGVPARRVRDLGLPESTVPVRAS
jgi:maltose O-acetyltransferase